MYKLLQNLQQEADFPIWPTTYQIKSPVTWKFIQIWVRIHYYWNNPRKSNIIAGIISTSQNECDWLQQQSSEKICQKQKKLFLLGDSNIDSMHYNEHKTTNGFLDSHASNSYLPYIILPSQHKSYSSNPYRQYFQ